MKITKTSIPLQQLISGETLSIKVFTCAGSKPGPAIYLQGNLHGSEIFGGALLTKLIEFLSKQKDICGRLTIVPLANPLAVQAQMSGFQFGRWNTQNGKNWNRIFSSTFKTILPGMAIEEKFASLLQSLTKGHDIILDIHSDGKQSVPHLYTAAASLEIFSPLETACQLIFGENDYQGAFDESCAAAVKSEGRVTHAATWEIGTQGTIDLAELNKQFQNLLNFLSHSGILQNTPTSPLSPEPLVFPLASVQTLCADSFGYLDPA